MLTQKEIFKYKNKKERNIVKKKIKEVNLFRYSRSLMNKSVEPLITEKKDIEYEISIKITANNTFCSLKKGKNLLFVSSAGKNKIKITKRKLKFNSKLIIENFLYSISKYIKKSSLIIIIKGPKKIRKNIIKQLSSKFRTNKYIVKLKELKCFNGCRPKKKRRKKQKGLRITK